mgnify:FL=1
MKKGFDVHRKTSKPLFKRPCVLLETQVRFDSNALVFDLKRTYVLE